MYVFGDLLRQFRVRAGLTQRQLADELGVSRNALNAWETLKARPRLSRELIIRLGEVLVLERDDLNQLLLALGYTLEPVEYPAQAQVVRHKAIETQYLKVTQQLELAPGVLWPQPGGRADCYQHVSLPVNYIERADTLASVRTQVLATAAPVVLTSAVKGKPAALHGMGGIGKTVIARALCDDSAVQEAFPDGILWATLGQTPNLLDQLRLWIEPLGGRLTENVPTVESLKRTLAALLKERTCLLILDDVWRKDHAGVFRVDAPRCRLLLTTRDAEIARELGAQVQPIPVMTPEDAIMLLEEWTDGHLAETDPALKEKIVKRLGYLPLAVKLAGAQLQRKDPEEWLRAFDVRTLKSERPEDLHDSLEQTFLLSLEALDGLPRRLYLSLAIFKEDEAAPQVAIAQLWQGLAELDADTTGELLDDLASRALLDLTPQGTSRAARLHDLMRDLISTELGEDGRLAAHQALLGAYRATCTGDGWHTASDDGYLYDHVAHHLAAVGAWNDLHGLFADQRWMQVRVPQRDYTYDGYLADLALAWERTLEDTARQITANQEPGAIAGCLRYRLIQSSINTLAGNYVPELVAQAVQTGLWTPARALSVAEKILDADRRAQIYLALLNTTRLTQKDRQEAQWLGLAAAQVIEDESARVWALEALAPQVPEPQRRQVLKQALELALAAAQAIWYEGGRAEEMEALAPQLTGALLEQALAAAQAIERESTRAEALAVLAPQVPEPQRRQVLEQGLAVAQARLPEEERARALEALAPQLTGALLKQALAAAQTIKGEKDRARVLAALAPQLPEPQRRQVLEQGLAAFQTIGYGEERARVLVVLAPLLTGTLLEQGLAAAQTIEYGEERARVLAALAPQVLEPQRRQVLEQALAAAQAIEGDRSRAWALEALAPQLKGALLKQGLAAAQTIKGEEDRARALAVLALQLPEPQRRQVLEQALAAARAIEHEFWRAEALAVLAPQLTGTLLEQGLAVTQVIRDEGSRVKALAALAPQVPEPQRRQVLEYALAAAQAIEDEEARARVLAVLAPQVSEPQRRQVLEQALAAAQAIWHTGERARVLAVLAPQLTGALLEQGLAAAKTIKGEGDRARVLAVLAPQVSEPQRRQVLEQGLAAAQAIEDESARVRALEALAPQLTGALLEQGLAAAKTIKGEGDRAKALAALAPQVPEPQRRQVLEQGLAAARATTWYMGDRAGALEALAPQLTGTLLEQALAAAKTNMYVGEPAGVLAALAPQVPEPQRRQVLEQALADAQAIKGERGRARVLAVLAPQLTGTLLEQALVAALTLQDTQRRAQSLVAFLPSIADNPGPLRRIRQALLELLSPGQPLPRPEVLDFIKEGPFRPPVLSSETLGAIAAQLIEICQEWQWL